MADKALTLRLNKVLRELNISLDRAVEFLSNVGCEIEARPTTKISQETYKLLLEGFNELDLIMAETAEIRSDIEFKEKNIGKFRTAGYFLELAKIIEKRKLLES